MAIPCLADSNTIHHAQVPVTGELVSDVIRDPSSQNLLSESGAGLLARYAPDVVTALPASPVDGQIAYYDTQDTYDTVWVFRYVSGGGTYPWKWLGGGVMFDTQADTMLRPSGGYASGNSGTPCELTVPNNLEGDYLVFHGARVNPTTDAARQSPNMGATLANDDNGLVNKASPTISVSSHPVVATAIAASSLFTLRYKNEGSGDAAFASRWITVRPMRVKRV